MEVAAAWAEVRVGVKKSGSRKSIYMMLDEGGSRLGRLWMPTVLEQAGSS